MYITFGKCLEKLVVFTTSIYELNYLYFFLLQNELDDVAKLWNSHKMCTKKGTYSAGGRPIIIYALPQIYSTQDYLVSVKTDEIELCKEECTFKGRYPCDKDVLNFACCTWKITSWTPQKMHMTL